MKKNNLELIVLASGSDGNAAVIRTQNGSILLDAGMPLSRLENLLAQHDILPSKIAAIVLSHTHRDHGRGVVPFVERYGIRVYLSAESRKRFLILPDSCCQMIEADKTFELSGIQIRPFALRHYPENLGFCFIGGGKKIGFITDLGSFDDATILNLSDCDALALEANYDQSRLDNADMPLFLKRKIQSDMVHFSNQQCLELLNRVAGARLAQVLLLHIGKETNTAATALKHIKSGLAAADKSKIVISAFDRKKIKNGLFL